MSSSVPAATEVAETKQAANNGFGDQTYWNRPTQGRQRQGTLSSKYLSLKPKTQKGRAKTSSRTPSPTSFHNSRRAVISPSRQVQQTQKSKEEENDEKDEKSIVKIMKSTLPKFSNEADWEMAIFELGLVLDRVWPHKEEMDIMEYMTSTNWHRSLSEDMEDRADRLIYFALTMAAQKDSYAKLQILASCHRDAVPCVMKNEGKKLYQMFQILFNMTNLHQASLPTVRAEFYAIVQKENESILKYYSRVDISVSTMAKLGERVSTGAWIYALGNGLRPEFKESKDGVLYTKDGFNTVMSVKTKLLSEETVLLNKSKKDKLINKEADDEIALVSALKIKEIKPTLPPKTSNTPKDITLFTKGKGGKGKGKGISKGNRWRAPATDWDNNWSDWSNQDQGKWTQPPKGKGKGKDNSSMDRDKRFDPQTLWCDIHHK
jgi:hypothetical protein